MGLMYEDLLWYRTLIHIADRLVYNFQFAREMCLARDGRDGKERILKSFFRPIWQGAALDFRMTDVPYGPGDGDRVRMNFEVRESGPHPTPMARLQTIGPYRDRDVAMSVGMRLTRDGKDEEATKKQCDIYYQRKMMVDFRAGNEESRGTLAGYSAVKAVRRFLLGQRVVKINPSMRQGDYDPGIALVRDVSFDYFEQIVTVFVPVPACIFQPHVGRSQTCGKIHRGDEGDWAGWHRHKT